MKTGFKLKRKFRLLIAYFNLFRFNIRKNILGFEFANLFLQRVDKISSQLILKKNGATIGENCDIESGQIFHNCKNFSNLFIGNNCHIGKNCFFDLKDKIIIRNNVVISMQCTFITHIDLSRSKLSIKYQKDHNPIIINNDCYIGVKTIILIGVELEKKVFVAANTLVVKSVKSNSLVAGSPAKFIKNNS